MSVVLWLLLAHAWITYAADDRKKAQPPKVQLKHHSFVTPLNHVDILEDWRLSAASIAARDRVLIHPAIPQRAGYMWSKKPLLTNHFEVTFQFRVLGASDPKELSPDQGFAFWYVMENHAETFTESVPLKAKSWLDGLEQLGLTLLGSRPKFHGFGAVLSVASRQKTAEPLVSGIYNNDTSVFQFRDNVPTANAKAIDFRNTLNPAQVRLIVTPTSVVGSLKQSPSLSWKECFRIENVFIKPGGYIGFTAWSGLGPQSDLVSVVALDVNNLDENAMGEEMVDEADSEVKEYSKMMQNKTRHFADQKEQAAHLMELTSMLQKHAEEAAPEDKMMYEQLQQLQTRMDGLDESCRTLVTELGLLVGDGLGKAPGAVSSIKENLVGMRKFFSNDSRTHRDHVEQLSSKIAQVKQAQDSRQSNKVFEVIAQQSTNLEKTVEKRNQNMTWMLITIVGCVLLIGLLMWNRMRYYEKKHFI